MRNLNANEIDVRVGSINGKGATLLLYKDARVDMNILDESGVKWKRSHELINGNLFCTISVWDDEIKEWISRQDVGVESQSEKEKGQASDAFKRAGFNFGIGRELYTAPFIWINSQLYDGFTKTINGKVKYGTYDRFSVKTIGYDDKKEINQLVIVNIKTNKVVFEMGKAIRPETDNETTGADQEILARAKATINKTLEEHGYNRIDQKKTFISMVLEKPTIDTLNDADSVMDALDNEGEEDAS